mmetsp:Transcript_15417/g.20090  ORF Transcript_15417/g.20090 Transcript_15417/m.20090 type:complete len:113 (-) Transcript_15417:153-491(-)
MGSEEDGSDTLRGEKAKQAKQLDQLTDHVQDGESQIDAVKAAEIMTALQSSSNETRANGSDSLVISKEDITVVVEQLEITEDTARDALKRALREQPDEDAVVVALRNLITCP